MSTFEWLVSLALVPQIIGAVICVVVMITLAALWLCAAIADARDKRRRR